MKYLRSSLLLLTAILVLSATPAFLFAQINEQVETAGRIPTPTDPEVLDPSIPPLVGGADYPYPIITYDPPAAGEPLSPDEPAAPVITVWYGNTQNFGQPGTPQEWINILGNVTGATSLTYSLNGGADKPLTIGSTSVDNPPRLAGIGDFNIEIHYTDLNDGANTVLIKANDGVSAASQVVTVNYDAGNTWPLPYTVDWGALPNIHAGAQPVDGFWSISGGALKTVMPGYDRLVALGGMNWTDYEVEVPVTIHSIDYASNSTGVGLIVRWLGHFDTDNNPNTNPNLGWRRLGALAWYRWDRTGNAAFEMLGNGGQAIATPRNDKALELDVEYIFKISVQSSTFAGNTSTYRFKFWPAGTPEPPQWFMTGTGRTGEPSAGSVVLVAHQAMVSWGDVSVRPIENKTFTINVQQPANGSITVTPSQATYEYGQTVEIRVQGEANNVLQTWTGDFSGTVNPLIFDITEDITVGAIMQTGTRPKLTVAAVGNGTVSISPVRPNNTYLYGEQVTLTPIPGPGSIFSGWSGALSGANNPAVIVMDQSKTITANFVSSNPDSPVSDDFNACVLDTSLWTFVSPISGTYEVNGTQLKLDVPANVSHNIWTEGNHSVRIMQPTQNVNFEIVTKFESVVTKRYQMQGILVEQDSRNFLRFETHHDGTHIKLYVAKFTNGAPVAVINNILLNSAPIHMRVTRVDSLWSVSYSYDGITWIAGGSFNHPMTVTKSGVFGGNHGLVNIPAHTAIVDFFFNSAAPIVPEDGSTLGFKVTVNKVGQGNVTLSPAKPTYACGEKVTVTAVPTNGWAFSGWSGALTGTNPSQQLTITGDMSLTATFVEQTERKLFLPIVIKR